MKKLLTYILILIVLVGGFSLVLNINKAWAAGACRWCGNDAYHKKGDIDTSNPPLTQLQCGYDSAPPNQAQCSGSSQKYWDPSATSTPGEAPMGTCRVPDTKGNIISVTTETACKAKGGNWDSALPPPPPASTLKCDKEGEELKDGKCVPKDTKYYFLSPLPDPNNGGKLQETFDPKGTGGGNLGGYLNLMIKLFIGICSVLAVIMIVIGGIEYMTSELPGNKEHGKERIIHAIFGLLLALGAYTLLYTINPDLLNTNLTSLGNVEVEVDLSEEVELPEMAQMNNDAYMGSADGTTEKCPEKIVAFTTSGGNFILCRSISAKVKTMVDKAWTEGIKLTGGGYRNIETQKRLRAQYCGGTANVMNPKAKCTPLVAFPGKSNHEHGLAVDFRCEGSQIRSVDNKCFLWLKKNASLMNLPSEPWHWSINGR